ncbi:hypothetical protein FLT15_23695 [Paenibacillus thiaminolyticus]|uniref:hypothetical protein n=1 Tax=Paenibacillus thiaminolyticus TaxID=49283 RepID=UPI0011652EAE|nr:hypothetical protein [Paenibacillus thiaminolyticus]NGP61239.1 hypothetical protein [Paenibacillus thiaminolyticus]
MWMNHDYKIEVRLHSEAIFSSGEKERNLVQSKVLADRYGFVYFHAKSLKGQLKRQAFWLLNQYKEFDRERAKSFFASIVVLFGINKEEIERFLPKMFTQDDPDFQKVYCQQQPGILRFGHLELDEQVRNRFIALQAEDGEEGYYRITPHDLIEAQTHIRTGIQLEDGKIKDRMLTTYHTVKRGLIFYSSITMEPYSYDAEGPRRVESQDMSNHLANLQRIVSSFRRIGAGIHRGRGEVAARLLVDGKEADYCKVIRKEGEQHATI